MEVYILDSLLRRNQVIDSFESLIWTERWTDLGDFQLDVKSTYENRTRFLPGTIIAINSSYRLMRVETTEDVVGSDGKTNLRISGRSLESVLEDRLSITAYDTAMWVLTGTPGDIAREMFDHICRSPGSLDAKDEIPFLQIGSIFSPGTIPESAVSITWEQRPKSLLGAIGDICSVNQLGFRLVRNFDTSELYFDIYSGNDRTTNQIDLSPVVFSVGLDNLENTTEFTTVEKSKNVAYVYSDYGYVIVYGEDVDPDETEGFDRRMIVVYLSVPSEHSDPAAALTQEGKQVLLERQAKTLFDGEVNNYSDFVYGIDYDLGDLVEMRNRDGIITYKRVTEQIFVSDNNGERSYPTLSLGTFIGADTWLSYGNKSFAWDEFTDEHWEDL